MVEKYQLDSYKGLAKKRRAKLDHKHQIERAKKNIYELLGFALIGLMVFTVLMVYAWIH